MNNNKRWLGILVAVTMLLLVASCSSRKKLVKPNHATTYEWMTAKMTMDVTAQGFEFNNVQGTLRMRRDSAIWISATTLGMEAIRTLITQDSVVMINRFDKTYLSESLEHVTTTWNIPLTLQDGQRMLLGNGNPDHVELQFGPYTAKIKYSDIQWDEPTSFPIKITNKYHRIQLIKQNQ